jgi:nicotinic acid mononucleotide adenylyltransferase
MIPLAKILADPFYGPLWPLLGWEGLQEAGFFEDQAPAPLNYLDSLNWCCTPFHLPSAKTAKPCVLLSTGAHCPPHAGHIEAMLQARHHLQQQGYEVLAGYLSPGHDEYIQAKTGAQALDIHQRLALLQELILSQGQGDWLRVDPWEGLFNTVAINFTLVIARLQAYLSRHWGQEIPVFYVCGADNARFALSFLLQGQAVVVGRPGYEQPWQHYRQRLGHLAHVHWVWANNPLSSTALRAQQGIKPRSSTCTLLLRLEEQDAREQPLLSLLQTHFEQVKIQTLREQRSRFEQYLKREVGLISLDAFLLGDFSLAISRAYDYFGQCFLGFVPRPGAPDLSVQVAALPKGRYWLLDDDSHTGRTLAFAQALLEAAGLEIEGWQTLQGQEQGAEILDARDFCLAAPQGGLVLSWKGRALRLPYCYPYVCPRVRASIGRPMAFSRSVWVLNRDYFRALPLKVGDLEVGQKAFFMALGFAEDLSLATLCEWHFAFLLAFSD